MRVFVTGGTGFIGQALVAALCERGDEVVVVTRSEARARALWSTSVTIVEADPCYSGAWQGTISGCDAVVNLAGAPLSGQRWNARYRQIVHDSRVDTTRFVVEGMAALPLESRPRVLVSASGLDYYGFVEGMFDDDEVSEEEPGGESFLSCLCWDWEEEARGCNELGVRLVLMRTGLVLDATGDALSALARPFRLHLGGRIGRGSQWMSWVHRQDVVGAYLFAIDSELTGPVNLVAPGNLRNRDFARELGKALGRKAWLPVPGFAVMAKVGPLGEYVLKGRRAVPTALQDAGYEFLFPTLPEALADIL